MEEVRGFEDEWEFAGTACFALALSQIDSAHSPACAWRPVALDAQEKTPGHLVVQRNGACDRTTCLRGAAGIDCPSRRGEQQHGQRGGSENGAALFMWISIEPTPILDCTDPSELLQIVVV